jgi:hypothetical protein
MRGIIIIALGHPAYGQMAANLGASIRVNSPDLPIHLVWADQALDHLSDQKKAIFHTMQECPHDYYHRENEKKVYIKAKTHLYDLTPFTETIFLDADTIICPRKPLTELFDTFSQLDMTMENRARLNLEKILPSDVYLWASISDIVDAYKLKQGFLYGLHSEFIYWKQNTRMSRFFDTVRETFDHPKVKTVTFNGDMPDEFAFAIAMLKHNLYPHQCPYIPLYWYLTDKQLGTSLEYVISNYHGYSIGGNATPDSVQRNYNRMAAAYFQRLGLQYPYKVRPKRAFMVERKVM